MIDSPYLVHPGRKVRLSDWPTADTGDFENKADAKPELHKNLKKLDEQQELLYASGKRALLVVFQAMDGGGKDGAIEHVFSGVNPQGCAVTSFKVPSLEEQSHDFLWRISQGFAGAGNDRDLQSLSLRKRSCRAGEEFDAEGNLVETLRLDQCVRTTAVGRGNDDPQVLPAHFMGGTETPDGSEAERPKEELEVLARRPEGRRRWDDYMEAYEDALRKCSTKSAPWYIVPADHKWYRNLVVSDTIVRALKKLKLSYPPPLKDADKIRVR